MRSFLCASSFWVASSVGVALNHCADEFDNTVLLQTKLAANTRDRDLDSDATWRTKPIRDASVGKRLHSHAHASGDIMETVREMTETIDDVEQQARQGPSGSWDEQTSTLTTFRTMIHEQLQAFLNSEGAQDQSQFNARKQQNTGCDGGQRWQPGGDVANAAAELARWRTKHQVCRSSEHSWLSYKTAAIASSSCASAGDIPTQHEVYGEHVTLAALLGGAQSQASTYALTDPPGKRACDLDQAQVEDHFCTWRSAHYYACAAAHDCALQIGLSELASEMQTRSENRRALWRTLEILSCRVGHMLSSMDNDATTEVSDFNATDNCSDIALDQSKFVLDLSVLAPLPACDHHLAAGATTSVHMEPSLVDAAKCQDFRDANYGANEGFQQASHVIPPQCQVTCPAVSYIPFVVPALCVNEPQDCQFYNHHGDACGSYDTATFVAGDSCCACGGGAIATPPTPSADLVVFDNADPALSVSPGTLTGGRFDQALFGLSVQAGGVYASSNREVSAGDPICGISFKAVSAESEVVVAISAISAAILSEEYPWSTMPNSIHINNADQLARVYEHGTSPAYRSLGNPTTDVHAIVIDADGRPEYSLNGAVYWSSQRGPVTYPWHVVVACATDPNLVEVQYLQC